MTMAEKNEAKKTTSLFVKILGLLVAVFVGLIAFIAMRPDEFHVTRSATIAAPPTAVFEHVNDLHKWEAWSPWDKIDPEMKKTYEGAETGVGSGYSWVGNSEVGEGKISITESVPNERIAMKLEMIKPMAAVNDVEFTFKPEGDATVVSWSIDGKNDFIGKAMDLFLNMDAMIGSQFDKGLASLKEIVEKKPE